MARHYKVPSAAVSAVAGIGTRRAGNTGGALPRFAVHDVFAAPVATSVSAATSLLAGAAGAGQLLTDGVTTPVVYANPDFPRNLTVWATGACTSVITITGTDQFGTAISEAISCNGAAIVAGTKVFKTITAISCAAYSDAAQTVSIGQGSILGTSRKIVGCGIDGGVYTTASGETTMVQETTRPVRAVTAGVHGVTFSTALAATKTYELAYFGDEAR